MQVFKIRLIAAVWVWSFCRWRVNDSPRRSHINLRQWDLILVNRTGLEPSKLWVALGPFIMSRYLAVVRSRSSRTVRHEWTMNPRFCNMSTAFGLGLWFWDPTSTAFCKWPSEQVNATRTLSSSLRSRGAFFRPIVAAVRIRQAIWVQRTMSPIEMPTILENNEHKSDASGRNPKREIVWI